MLPAILPISFKKQLLPRKTLFWQIWQKSLVLQCYRADLLPVNHCLFYKLFHSFSLEVIVTEQMLYCPTLPVKTFVFYKNSRCCQEILQIPSNNQMLPSKKLCKPSKTIKSTNPSPLPPKIFDKNPTVHQKKTDLITNWNGMNASTRRDSIQMRKCFLFTSFQADQTIPRSINFTQNFALWSLPSDCELGSINLS